MKRLILITNTYPYGAGESTFVLPELHALADRFDITVVSCGTEEKPLAEVPEGINVVRYTRGKLSRLLGCLLGVFNPAFHREALDAKRVNGLPAIKRCLLYFSDAKRFGRWLSRQSFAKEADIIYSFWHTAVLYGVLRHKRQLGDPVVVARAHGFDLYRERSADGYQPFKRDCDRLLDRMYLISRVGYDYYLEHYSVSEPPKCELRYLGADNDMLSPWEKSETLRVYSCSFLKDIKRVELIIEALSLIDRPIEWVHFGGGELRAKLEDLAARLLGSKPGCSYRFTGTVENAFLREYVSTHCFDCFVTASETEGLPISIVEASSFGIPAVATNAGGIGEIVRDGGGILLPVELDARTLADALESVKRQTPAEREAMRAAALRIWRESFVASENAERFSAELEGLCRDR